MTCPQCGASLSQGLRFCKQCWSPVDTPTASPGTDAPSPTATPSPAPHHDQRGPLFGVGYNEPTEPASGPLHSTNVPLAPVVAQRWTPAPISPAEGKPSSRAVAAMILSIASIVFFCGFFFTIPIDLVGLALAFFELRAISRGERPLAGRNIAFIGLVITSIVLAVKLFLLLAVFS